VTLKRIGFLFAASFLLFAITSTASAQQFDIAFGFGTIGGTPISDVSASDLLNGNHSAQYIGGGGYPSFGADFLFFKKYIGVGGEVAWRAHQNLDTFGEPYRPILYDFNGVFAPPIGKKAQAELQAGVGALSLRFYQGFFQCSFVGCTDYVSSNHFLAHFSGGVRLYAYHNFFIRPEYHYYWVHNNFEFAGPRVTRYTVSIGYSLRNQM
jgi:hypothetical protein